MTTTPTVFVLGAGASAPYDFPVGAVLQEQVINNLSTDGGGLGELGPYAVRDIEAFRSALSLAAMPSIDAFLEGRREFLEVGKAAIAQTLMRFEDGAKICKWEAGFQERSWLHYMWQHLDNDFERFDSNKIAYITFNYDRSLEHFLITSLVHSSGKPQEACAKKISAIPIIHLHGRLGYLPWQQSVARPYNTEVTPQSLKLCVDNIKVVHEDIIDSDFEQAKQLLQRAERIYFLGFGYYKKNVERLNIANLGTGKANGTAYEMTAAEVRRVVKLTGGSIALENSTCLGLLRGTVEWD